MALNQQQQQLRMMVSDVTARAGTFMAAAAVMEQYAHLVSMLMAENAELAGKVASYEATYGSPPAKQVSPEPGRADDTRTGPAPAAQSH